MYKRGLGMLLSAVLFMGLLPTLGAPASAATLEERQQAIVDVAWAYYDKGHSAQYDGVKLVEEIERSDVGKTRSTNYVAPEYATPQETMYTVCSDFAHQVYWEAYHYELIPGGTAGSCTTSNLVAFGSEEDKIPNNPNVLYRWDKEKNTDISTTEAIKRVLSVCQKGDIITVIRNTKSGLHGHSMIYIGEAFGDGKAYLLHSSGLHMTISKKVERREYKPGAANIDTRHGVHTAKDSGGGTIMLSEAESKLLNSYKKNAIKMNVLRPLVSMSEQEYPITAATKYRTSHPRLAIDRYLDKTRLNSTFPGDTVTMTLQLANKSGTAYTVPVTEKVPVGAKVKTPFEGAMLSGDTMQWEVALAAGETKTLTCTYEITAQRGAEVVFDGGFVGDIPSNTIPLSVSGAKLNAEAQARLAALAKGDYKQVIKAENPTNDTLAEIVYTKILGLNVKLPDFAQIAAKLIKEVKTPSQKNTRVFLTRDEVAAEDMDAFRMLVPRFRYGRGVWYPKGIDRCSDLRDKHLEPGDIVVRSNELKSPGAGKSEQLIYLGSGKYLQLDKNNRLVIAEEPEFFKSICYQVFYVLRPTLSYDDIHAQSVPVELPVVKDVKFTDVKESDWFYSYVRELVGDGTVSGMTETEFAPNATLTYGQALKLIALAAGEKEPAKTGTHWASGWMSLAKSKGWITKDVDPDAAITRLQLCKLATGAKKLIEQPKKNPFADTEDASVLALYNAGVISGMTAKTFEPNGLLTRAQITKIISLLREV